MYLFQRGANINCADDKSGRRPLHYAVEMGNKELVEFLIKRLGADVNATTFDLNTPLHLAAGRDNSSIVHLLLACGASRHACNSEGHSPYEVAKSDKLIGLLRTVEYSDFKITGIWKQARTFRNNCDARGFELEVGLPEEWGRHIQDQMASKLKWREEADIERECFPRWMYPFGKIPFKMPTVVSAV